MGGGPTRHQLSQQAVGCLLIFELGAESVSPKARGGRGKKRLVLKSQACTPEKHKTEISTATTDGLSANDELVSTPGTGAHQS